MYDHPNLGKNCYTCLPMGVINSSEIFQHKMNDLFQWFDNTHVYI